jgi:hypothetical protein
MKTTLLYLATIRDWISGMADAYDSMERQGE